MTPTMMPSVPSTTPRLSVITAAYQHGRYLAECICSVVRQTCREIEQVIVDDASTDDTWAIASALQANDDRLVLVRHRDNRGPASAFSSGGSLARGEWLLKVDADDWIEPDYVEQILRAAEDDPRRNVIFSPAHVIGQGMDYVFRYPAFDPAGMIETFMIPGPAAIRRELWAAVGGYDPTMRSGEDWDFYIRAERAVGLRVHQLDRALWHYRQHGGPRASADGMRRVGQLKRYWRGHTRETALARSRTWAGWLASEGRAA